MKKTRLQFKTTKEYSERVHRVAGAIEKTASEFVRDAINEKIERLAKRNRKVAEVLNEQAA